jgi:hypothetical protein
MPPATSKHAQIAQLVEQRIENPRVAGSIPALGTITPLRILPRQSVSVQKALIFLLFSDLGLSVSVPGCPYLPQGNP